MNQEIDPETAKKAIIIVCVAAIAIGIIITIII